VCSRPDALMAIMKMLTAITAFALGNTAAHQKIPAMRYVPRTALGLQYGHNGGGKREGWPWPQGGGGAEAGQGSMVVHELQGRKMICQA
jgi:hypothetical protein